MVFLQTCSINYDCTQRNFVAESETCGWKNHHHYPTHKKLKKKMTKNTHDENPKLTTPPKDKKKQKVSKKTFLLLRFDTCPSHGSQVCWDQSAKHLPIHVGGDADRNKQFR